MRLSASLQGVCTEVPRKGCSPKSVSATENEIRAYPPSRPIGAHEITSRDRNRCKLYNRTSSTYRVQSTKQRGLRFGARLTVETLKIELALV
jgi:hypothetical protein